MAERKATNKYYPPDWDPSKGSINKHLGQHPLRERARKLSEGVLIIRFEMPFNIWCGHCDKHIARGVRFNAEKKQVGAFYSTSIWSFRMKCHLCSGWIEIRTDPKNSEYVVVEGARRKVEERTAESLEVKAPLTVEAALQMQSNPFFRLEHQVQDERVAKAALPKLSAIQEGNERAWKNDYETSRLVRRKFREQRRQMQEEGRRIQEMKDRLSIDLPLVPERVEDVAMARNVAREQRQRKRELELTEAAQRISEDSIFSKGLREKQSRRLLSFSIEAEDSPAADDGEALLETLDFTRKNLDKTRPNKR